MSERTQSQIGKMSRRKGKAFERVMARYFTEWTGEKWESTRNSGRTDLKGDIYCTEKPDLPLIIECKHREAYTVHAMLRPTKGFIDMVEENRQKLREAKKCTHLMLIVKNETGIWVHWEDERGNSAGIFRQGRPIRQLYSPATGYWCHVDDLTSGVFEGVKFARSKD